MLCKNYVEAIRMASPCGNRFEIIGCYEGLHQINRSKQWSQSKEWIIISEISLSNVKIVKKTAKWLNSYLSKTENDTIDDLIEFEEKFNSQLFLCPQIFGKLTLFTRQVYRYLIDAVKIGSLISYTDLAQAIGHPKAQRAVGAALKRNPLPVLIPCHRVIKKTGNIGGYGGSHNDPLKNWLINHEKKIQADPEKKR